MEHDLFWSKLKPFVDRTVLSNIIESSCTGENSHRTAAMELVLERSIQERRKRLLVKAKDVSPPDPTTPHQSSEVLRPQLQPPAPTTVPAPQPLSQPTSSPTVTSSSTNTEARQEPLSLSEPRRGSTGTRGNEPATGSVRNSSVPHTVELECMDCGAKIPPFALLSHRILSHPSMLTSGFKCVGCGTKRVGPAAFCINCKGMFV